MKAWLEENPGPWFVGMWTYAENGSAAGNSTAGYIISKVDIWEITYDGSVKFTARDGSAEIVLIGQAIGKVEEVLSEGFKILRFLYVNLTVNAKGFIPYVGFTINQAV